MFLFFTNFCKCLWAPTKLITIHVSNLHVFEFYNIVIMSLFAKFCWPGNYQEIFALFESRCHLPTFTLFLTIFVILYRSLLQYKTENFIALLLFLLIQSVVIATKLIQVVKNMIKAINNVTRVKYPVKIVCKK